MGNFRPLQRKCWEKFLKEYAGFEGPIRTKGSHDQWTKKGKRTIPVWGDEKEIPAFHLKQGCRTIDVTLEFLYDWAKREC
jgi:hypothetical protein